jgi:rod shape-determining protein MreC
MRTPAPETRPGNPALLVVLIVMSLVMMTVYFREGDAGPLHATRRGLLFVTTPVARFGGVLASPFNAVGDWFGGFRVSRDEMETLKRQNAEMRTALARLEEQRQENARLKTLVKLAEAFPGKSVVARVIGRQTDSWERSIMIDRGTVDGVTKGTPAVAGQGLLGQVLEVAPNSARVRLITHQSSGVAVLVQSSRATGVVRGSVDGALSLDFVDPKRLPKVGDVVVTSGSGGSYPKRVEVVSRVPIADIEEVAVLVGIPTSPVVGGVE